MDIESLDPAKLLEFHGLMISAASDDERVRHAWKESNSAHRRRRREGLREAWRAHHEHMSELHASLSAEHAAKAAALQEPGSFEAPSRNGSGGP